MSAWEPTGWTTQRPGKKSSRTFCLTHAYCRLIITSLWRRDMSWSTFWTRYEYKMQCMMADVALVDVAKCCCRKRVRTYIHVIWNVSSHVHIQQESCANWNYKLIKFCTKSTKCWTNTCVWEHTAGSAAVLKIISPKLEKLMRWLFGLDSVGSALEHAIQSLHVDRFSTGKLCSLYHAILSSVSRPVVILHPVTWQ